MHKKCRAMRLYHCSSLLSSELRKQGRTVENFIDHLEDSSVSLEITFPGEDDSGMRMAPVQLSQTVFCSGCRSLVVFFGK